MRTGKVGLRERTKDVQKLGAFKGNMKPLVELGIRRARVRMLWSAMYVSVSLWSCVHCLRRHASLQATTNFHDALIHAGVLRCSGEYWVDSSHAHVQTWVSPPVWIGTFESGCHL